MQPMVAVAVVGLEGAPSRDARAAHEAALTHTAAEHGGRVVRAVGADQLVVFASARAAVLCAVGLQRAPGAEGLRVRAGVHVGEPEPGADGPRGPAIDKAARIAAVAEGGTVLASGPAAALADEAGLPGDVWLDEPRPIDLPGLPGQQPVARVRWEGETVALRIVIADDSALMREGAAAVLREAGMDVVGQVGDAEALHAAVWRLRPDVAVVDIRMPPTWTDEGIEAARHIKHALPAVGVLVLSQHLRVAFALQLLDGRQQGIGYLLKDRISDIDVLLEAIRRVARGGCVVDAELAAELVTRTDAADALRELTTRERDVLALVAEGLSNRAIAERMVVSARTVETHVRQIFAKLGLGDDRAEHRRVAAVLTYLRATARG